MSVVCLQYVCSMSAVCLQYVCSMSAVVRHDVEVTWHSSPAFLPSLFIDRVFTSSLQIYDVHSNPMTQSHAVQVRAGGGGSWYSRGEGRGGGRSWCSRGEGRGGGRSWCSRGGEGGGGGFLVQHTEEMAE